eukprot:scpid107764/ scgid26583/ 
MILIRFIMDMNVESGQDGTSTCTCFACRTNHDPWIYLYGSGFVNDFEASVRIVLCPHCKNQCGIMPSPTRTYIYRYSDNLGQFMFIRKNTDITRNRTTGQYP